MFLSLICVHEATGKVCLTTNLDLVTPTSKVTEGLDGHAYVGLQGQRVHGSRVHGLYGGQLLLVFLHQICKPEGTKSEAIDFELYNVMPQKAEG